MRRRQFAAATAAVVALGSAATVEAQQTYPSKAIRVVIPYPPGGSNEIIGRIMAEELTKRLGQPVLIDNRPGGSTVIGTELVAKSPPDGYTLLATSHRFRRGTCGAAVRETRKVAHHRSYHR